MGQIELETTKEFKRRLSTLSREELLEFIAQQSPKYIKQINRIEWVFKNKLGHLTWDDGSPIESRDLTNEELCHLIDPPFIFDMKMAKKWGFNEEQQKHIHIASEPVLWCKSFLGLEPRVYQTLVLRDPNVNRVMRFGRRMGKALALDTPILTPIGWSTMGDIKEGDQVLDENGKPCNVTFVTEVMENRKCYNIVFSDGSVIKADHDHQWAVETKRIRKSNARNKYKQLPPMVLTTGQMLEQVKIGSKQESNYSIKVTKPIRFTEEGIDLPISPYLLGFWLGDGVSANGLVSIGDEDVKESIYHIENDGYNIYKAESTKYEYRVEGLAKLLNLLGLKNNKHIPHQYMMASVEQRFELLKGLMDTDGSCDQNGWCEFSSSNPYFAEQVFDLIIQLGFKATKEVCESWLNGVRHKDRVRIHFKSNTPVFKLQRKLDRQSIKPGSGRDRRYIVDITPIESEPVKCISVDSPNHLYLAGRECIPTHNTFCMSIYLLWYSYTHTNGKSIVLAPMKSQVGVIFDAICEMAERNEIVKSSIVRAVASPQYEINFSNGSSIKLFTTGMKSNSKADVVRGQEAHVIVLDEMDYMGKEDLVAVLPMLQKTSEDQEDKVLIAASTPTGQRNMFWDWNHDPSYSAFWYPTYCNPLWEQKEEERLRNSTTQLAFQHEYEADWGEDADGVYPRRLVDHAFFDGEPWEYKADIGHPKSIYVFGIDWDKYGAGVNIVVVEICSDDNPLYPSKIRVAYREEISKDQFLLHKAVDRVVQLNEIFKPKHIYADRGYGEMQMEHIHLYGKEHPETRLQHVARAWAFNEVIEVPDPYTHEKVKKDLKPFMVDNLRYMLEQKKIIFNPADEDLYLQMISYIVIRTSISNRPVFGPGGSAPDHAHDALLLAAFAVTYNYDTLLNPDYAVRGVSVSNDTFLPMFTVSNAAEEKAAEKIWDAGVAPVYARRALTYNKTRSSQREVKRKMF
jgi:hypothetical protein